MIITQLKGGLGNQMFQYAFGRYLAVKNNTELKLDLTYLLDRTPKENFVERDFDLPIFNIQKAIASPDEIEKITGNYNLRLQRALYRVVKSISRKSTLITEPHYHFSNTAFNATDNTYLIGYGQSEKYFKPIESIIRAEFTFKHVFDTATEKMAATIRDTNSVCIHVRRADFVGHPNHDICDINYFMHAIEIIRKEVHKPFFYIYSDDVAWCQQNMILPDSQIIGHDYLGSVFRSHFYLMLCCKHFIIANSSFAWWAVWLNTNPNKIVIAPKRWFNNKDLDTKDLIPTTWRRI